MLEVVDKVFSYGKIILKSGFLKYLLPSDMKVNNFYWFKYVFYLYLVVGHFSLVRSGSLWFFQHP